MALETKDINNASDMQNYVEGCLNDLAEGVSTVDETMSYMEDYTLRVIDIASASKKPTTPTSEVPVGSVVKSDYQSKYEKCIKVIKRFDAGIIGMYDL